MESLPNATHLSQWESATIAPQPSAVPTVAASLVTKNGIKTGELW